MPSVRLNAERVQWGDIFELNNQEESTSSLWSQRKDDRYLQLPVLAESCANRSRTCVANVPSIFLPSCYFLTISTRSGSYPRKMTISLRVEGSSKDAFRSNLQPTIRRLSAGVCQKSTASGSVDSTSISFRMSKISNVAQTTSISIR